MAVYKNANILLIFLILLNLVVITGTFIFFEKSFEKIQARYEVKSGELNNMESDLSQKYKDLQMAQKEIRTKLQGENATAARYQEVSFLKQGLEQESTSLEAEKKRLNEELAAQQASTAEMKAKASLAQARQGQIKSEIGAYNEEIRRINTLIIVVQEQIVQMRNKVQTA